MRSRFVVDPVWKPIDAGRYKRVLHTFAAEAAAIGLIGLDLEWTTKRVFVNDEDAEPRVHVGKVATVQLSTQNTSMVIKLCDVCALLDGTCQDPLAPLSRHWPSHRVGQRENSREVLARVKLDLQRLLADESIVKVGVGIMGDKKKLERDYEDLSLASCVDLNVLAHHVSEREGGEGSSDLARRHPFSLKDLLQACCQRHLTKDVFVVRSDWGGGLGALSPSQVTYAAEDAEASFDIGLALLGRRGCHCPSEGEEGAATRTRAVLEPLIGVTTTRPARGGTKCRKAREERDPATHTGNHVHGRAKPYYDNINVFDVDMRLVFTVDLSKAKWYVHKKKLAKVVEWRADPATTTPQIAAIQLSFAPDFSKFNDAHIRKNMDYFKQPKDNVCVVCGGGGGGGGAEHALVRFAIVPFMYRKHFPSVYMSHNSYDLVLVCTTCFPRARAVYEKETRRVADAFQVPIAPLTPRDLEAYRGEIEKRAQRLASDLRAYDEPERAGSLSPSAAALAVHPALLLKVMAEYADMCACREEILTVLKYAKALDAHHTESDKQSIPPPRLREISDFVSAHAPKYPFYDETCSSVEEQNAALEKRPVGKESAQFLLRGCSGGGCGASARTFREVLAQYWFQTHPYLLDIMTPTTRAEKKQDAASADTAAPARFPLVDSHGFFVVRTLLEAHAYRQPAGALSPEQATGQFIYRWRSVFCDCLTPQHMPQGWRKEDGVLL